MYQVIPYYKPLGLTPLQAIEKLRSEQPKLKDIPITYAGRLDPMAEGLLLLLAGEAVHDKEKFLSLGKVYKAEILFGVSTDSFDILGMPVQQKISTAQVNQQRLNLAINELKGQLTLRYPPYSSKPVNGKPLWWWARQDKLNQISLPRRTMQVLSANLESLTTKPWLQIIEQISQNINLVKGDFRQKKVTAAWQSLLNSSTERNVGQIAEIEFKVASGTYIRSLVQNLGQQLQCPATLFHLKRTSIGQYKI